jgi:photosystem II stability/assembly factor-like uncharacterized protein
MVSGAAIALIVVGLVAWLLADGGDDPVSTSDPGPVHVHALGVDPADGALFIATHTGLYRVAEEDEQARRVSDRHQDTMGFTIVGPNRFLGSGHPDLRDDLPPHLGLIESTDAGQSWESVSLLGEADFHVLRMAGQRIYGYDSSNDRLLVSGDAGRTWDELQQPGPVVDLAVSPVNTRRIVLASAGGQEEGLFESRNGGRTWKQINTTVGLLAWPAQERLYLVTGGGEALTTLDGGRKFARGGEIGGQPAAFLAQGASELYVALHDGTIKRSTDGGNTWAVRSTP